jgi:hypothetical protein
MYVALASNSGCSDRQIAGGTLRVGSLAFYAVGRDRTVDRPNRGSGSGAGNLGAAVLALLVRRAPSATGSAAAARNFRVGFFLLRKFVTATKFPRHNVGPPD